jgi:hypothetical protein
MREPGRTAWQVELTWWAGLFAWLAVTSATLLAVSALVSAPRVGVELQALVLDAAFAAGEVSVPAAAPAAVAYEGSGPFELWPGTGVTVAEAELATLSAAEARARLANAFADRRLADGAGWTASLADASLAGDLDMLERAVLHPLAEAELGRALLRLGLDNGTRLADWPTQAANNPGQPVQPIVGVFVTLPVELVQGADPRRIGERVVAGLATLLAEGGAEAARAAMANAQLAAALEAALDGPVWQAWRAAFSAAWVPRDDALERRLTEAQDVLAGAGVDDDPLADAWIGADLEGASPEETRERTLAALAERAYLGGSDTLQVVLATPEARARAAAAGPWIDAIDARAHQRYALWAWVSGVVALLLLVIVALLQQGRWRVLAPGVLLLAAGGPWLWLWWNWSARADGTAAAAEAIPASAVALGLPAAARAWSTHLLAASADVAAGAVVWPPAAVAGAGAAMLALTLLAALVAWLRPPKRGRF